MALVSLQDVSIGYRGPSLLEHVSCQIESGGRIGLLGRNGAGKSTLLKMLRGEVQPDHGTISVAPGIRVAYLQQDVPQGTGQTVAEVVREGLPEEMLEADTEWEGEQRIEKTLSQMDLVGEVSFDTLSSGMKRRVLLAKAIVSRPELLLLDEPTNHLDIESIAWLEGFLLNWPSTLIFVTHDRMFLRRLATRILEIDRGQLFDWSCDYDTFLSRKEAALAAQEKQEALFDKKLAQEEAWIRQGIKARRTRNEGRVRALKAMREQRRQRRDNPGSVQLNIQTAERSGQLVVEAKGVSFAYPDQPILNEFSTLVMRGDKVGIIGPNGAGKTTLLRVLLGQQSPDEGSVRTGTNLQIAYFDQLRDQLDPEQTIEQNVGQGRSHIDVAGKQKHVIGYLQEFLFAPERARTQVKFLSGGERNRILLAKLFAKPANLIVLDEPTNDLDSETLELLEERLVAFEGTILMVSHDRAFLNNVVSSTIVFEPSGVKEYVGGYDDWLAQRKKEEDAVDSSPKPAAKPRTNPKADGKRKLSYNEQRELKDLPARIEEFEAAVASLHEAMAEPEFYKRPGAEISAAQAELNELETQLRAAYARWEELEAS